MVNKELEHLLRPWEKSVLRLIAWHHFSTVLVFAWPGKAHGYKRSIQIIYPLHFEVIKLPKTAHFFSTAILTCLPKQVIFCRH